MIILHQDLHANLSRPIYMFTAAPPPINIESWVIAQSTTQIVTYNAYMGMNADT